MKISVLIAILALSLSGCAGQVQELQMRDAAGTVTAVEFPKGTITGAASKDQALTLAQLFVNAHNLSIAELFNIKEKGRKSLENDEAMKQSFQAMKQSFQRIESAIQSLDSASRTILEASKSNQEIAQKTLQLIEEMSKRQGTGEITLFYPVNSPEIKKSSFEYERLVHFADFLSRECRGRKVVFISIGSASAFGDKRVNQRLAVKRSEAPLEILAKYLVNIPHEFFRAYGTGEMYSPRDVPMKEHQKYQHVRVIAFYETEQIPSLPGETQREKASVPTKTTPPAKAIIKQEPAADSRPSPM